RRERMKTFTNDLTTRQYNLYKYLKEQDDFKHLSEIVVETDLYGDLPESNINNSNAIRQLKKDIQALKKSGIIQTVILSCTFKGVKIASKEEYEDYSKRVWGAINRRAKLQALQDKKAGLDGQMRLVFNTEKPIIEAFKEVGA
ncbi:MAG TPA: hypothetical protein VIK89_14785, partial [Cytophagaceae bacterium]